MQIPPIDGGAPPASLLAGPATVRVSAGNLAGVPLGSLLEATVTSVGPREAVLNVGGQQLTVRPGTNLTGINPGTVLLVRVPVTTNAPTLELIGRVPPTLVGTVPLAQPSAAPAPIIPLLPNVAPLVIGPQGERGPAPTLTGTGPAVPGGGASAPNRAAATGPDGARAAGTPLPANAQLPSVALAAPAKPATISLVDVLSVLSDGKLQVRLDGGEAVASSADKLAPGGRYVVQVERTPAGVTLRPVPVTDTPELATSVATAVLRGTRPPDLGAALKPLLAELTALQTNSQPNGTTPAVRAAAGALRETLRTFIPGEARPPNQAELRSLVENGGLHFEAKLGRVASGAPPLVPAPPLTPPGVRPAATPATGPVAQPAPAATTGERPAPGTAVPTAAATPPVPPATAAPAQTVSSGTAPVPVPQATPRAVQPATSLAVPTAGGGAPLPAAPLPQVAAAVVGEVLQAFLPTEVQPQPSAQPARDNGDPQPTRHAAPAEGTAVRPGPDAAAADRPAANGPARDRELPAATQPAMIDTTAPRAERGPAGADLKGDLLRLLQAVQDIGGTVSAAQAPAARAALDGIEAQQATNALAQASGTPHVLQVPFPDNGTWRTLHLALDSERRPGRGSGEQAGGSFRMLMHVPLTELGDTWIDAGVADGQFRAVMYLDQPDTRDRVRAELPNLRAELRDGGFREVLLDVRPTADLPARHRKQGAAMRAGRPETVSVIDVRA